MRYYLLAQIFISVVSARKPLCLCRRMSCSGVVFSGHDGHRGPLTSLACNKDGTLVLTGSVDGQAKLINTSTGKVRAVRAVFL